MTKRELVSILAEKTGKSKKETEAFIKDMVGVITSEIKKGNKVSITSFGTFYLGKIAKRRGRDPQTGKEITIPDMRIPRFRAGKGLKEEVR
ncbi:MAG: HU family DNA-binding protein [Patescibacteria group bacterium]|nr:HU family DNA-binding protein [Patescibacteria group bacterium]